MSWSLRLRKWHAYIGLLIAPSVLFFALTGILQIFNLHEAHGGYHPALILEKLSVGHKDQEFEAPREQPAPAHEAASAAAGGAEAPAGDDDELKRVPTYLLKW